MVRSASNPTLKFAPSGRWDAPSARPLYLTFNIGRHQIASTCMASASFQRTAGVLIALSIVGAISVLRPYWLGPRANEQQVFVESELGKVALPPGASPHEIQRGSRPEKALASRAFDITSPQNDVVRSIEEQLSALGWKFVLPRKIKEWGRDYGGWERRYCKGEYVAALEYAGQNSGSGWTYALDMLWQAHDSDAQPCNAQDHARKAAQGR